MRKYFIHNGEAENGPFDIEQLKTMQIKSETPIWFEGLQNWTTAQNVDELKSIIAITSTPPKFENFAQQNSNINPPTFNKKANHTVSEKEPKKKNILGNIYYLESELLVQYLYLEVWRFHILLNQAKRNNN